MSAADSASVSPVRVQRPAAVAFDVVGTLFSLDPLRPSLTALGLPDAALETWFARFLRDAFALDTIGVYRPFAEVATAALEAMLPQRTTTAENRGAAIARVLASFATLPAFPDVAGAFATVRDAGVPLLLVTNGSEATTRKMVTNAGLDGFVDVCVSVDEVRHWKPRREVYLHAASKAGVDPARLALVAAHDWDIAGAAAAGLVTGAVVRPAAPFSAAFRSADVSGASVAEAVAQLLSADG